MVENAKEIHSWQMPSHETSDEGTDAIFRGVHLFWPSLVGECTSIPFEAGGADHISPSVLYALSALFHEVKDRRNRNSGYDAHGGKGSRHSTSTYNTNPEHQQVNPAGGAYNTYPEQHQAGRGHHIV